jgi:hypothetical protein
VQQEAGVFSRSGRGADLLQRILLRGRELEVKRRRPGFGGRDRKIGRLFDYFH